MRANIAAPLRRALMAALPLCLIALAAAGQDTDPRQAVCQSSWESCLASADGKDWKPVYDRCVKARSRCLGGLAYAPAIVAGMSSTIAQGSGSGSDPANADPATRAARCQNGRPRGDNSSCTLAAAADGYGQNFSLVGPGVPLSRIQRASSVVKCAGGTEAMFYPNGRIESCTLDNYGAMGIALTDYSGKVVTCAARAAIRFDPEGRVLSCERF